MLENIALSISTAIFMLCAAIVNSVFPTNDSVTAMALAETAQDDLVGKWNSAGKIVEFTKNGHLILDGITMAYTRDGDSVTAVAVIDGKERTYTMTVERVTDRVMKLNGIPMYKIDSPS